MSHLLSVAGSDPPADLSQHSTAPQTAPARDAPQRFPLALRVPCGSSAARGEDHGRNDYRAVPVMAGTLPRAGSPGAPGAPRPPSAPAGAHGPAGLIAVAGGRAAAPSPAGAAPADGSGGAVRGRAWPFRRMRT